MYSNGDVLKKSKDLYTAIVDNTPTKVTTTNLLELYEKCNIFLQSKASIDKLSTIADKLVEDMLGWNSMDNPDNEESNCSQQIKHEYQTKKQLHYNSKYAQNIPQEHVEKCIMILLSFESLLLDLQKSNILVNPLGLSSCQQMLKKLMV